MKELAPGAEMSMLRSDQLSVVHSRLRAGIELGGRHKIVPGAALPRAFFCWLVGYNSASFDIGRVARNISYHAVFEPRREPREHQPSTRIQSGIADFVPRGGTNSRFVSNLSLMSLNLAFQSSFARG
jgi:hypothetical protein